MGAVHGALLEVFPHEIGAVLKENPPVAPLAESLHRPAFELSELDLALSADPAEEVLCPENARENQYRRRGMEVWQTISTSGVCYNKRCVFDLLSHRTLVQPVVVVGCFSLLACSGRPTHFGV